MTAIYIPKPKQISPTKIYADLTNYMKRDGTAIPTNDISWNNKKLLNLAESGETNSATTKGYVDIETNKVEDQSNIVSIKSGYLYYYKGNYYKGREAKLYFNGANIVTLTNFTYTIPMASQGKLVIGDKVAIDIYEVYIINRAVTDFDIDMYSTRLLWKYEIRYKSLRAYLPTGTSDVATKYYVDNLSMYLKNPTTVDLNMNTKRIINLGPPTGGSDAASRWWVEQELLKYLKTTATAGLNMNNFIITGLPAPVNTNDAVNMSWVNSQSYIKSLLTANLDAGSKSIINLAAPVINGDAVNKAYVDGKAKNLQLLSGSISFSSASFNTGVYIFSLISSSNGNGGYYWPLDGRVLRLAYNVTSSLTGYTMTGIIALLKNTGGITESAHSILANAQKGMKIYTPAISYYTGDTMSFTLQNIAVQTPVGTSVASTITVFVHALVEFDFI